MSTLERSAETVRAALRAASAGLVDREALVELIALSAVAGEHVLVVGPPGTAKSEAVRRVAGAFGGRYFEYLLGRFTEPSEIFGPVDLRKLKEGLVETETRGMLPEADLAFLDEVFLGSTAILNTLLGLLNERHFRRGHTRVQVPLRVCVGATNDLPDDITLAAFADRFLTHVFVEPIADPLLEDLLGAGWALERARPQPVGLEHLDALAGAARGASLDAVRPLLARAIRSLRGAGIALSDRRAVKTQKLVAAAAVLDGRATPTAADLWPIVYAVPTAAEQITARDVLRPLLESTRSEALTAAAEAASRGPLVRAARLVEAARRLLDAPPEDRGGPEGDAWRLKLEGVAREIDAGFSPEHRPAELAETRAALVAALAVEGAPQP